MPPGSCRDKLCGLEHQRKVVVVVVVVVVVAVVVVVVVVVVELEEHLILEISAHVHLLVWVGSLHGCCDMPSQHARHNMPNKTCQKHGCLGATCRVPLEIRVQGEKEPIYELTLEDLGRVNEQPVLPFNAYGTLAWARGEFDNNSASSQVGRGGRGLGWGFRECAGPQICTAGWVWFAYPDMGEGRAWMVVGGSVAVARHQHGMRPGQRPCRSC
jgi:hypothetical protein